MWDGNAGTEEERRVIYEENKERASLELPEFCFEIKETDTDTEDEQYIYVTNDSRTYASPINIVVSNKEADMMESKGHY